METGDKLKALFHVYMARFADGPAKEADRFSEILVLTHMFDLELGGTGLFAALEFHPNGILARETAEALRELGAVLEADALEEAIQIVFGDERIPIDHRERERRVREIDADKVQRIEALNEQIYQDEGPTLEDRLCQLIVDHEPELVLGEDEAVTAVVLEGDWRQCQKCMDAWQEEPRNRLVICPCGEYLTLLRSP